MTKEQGCHENLDNRPFDIEPYYVGRAGSDGPRGPSRHCPATCRRIPRPGTGPLLFVCAGNGFDCVCRMAFVHLEIADLGSKCGADNHSAFFADLLVALWGRRLERP